MLPEDTAQQEPGQATGGPRCPVCKSTSFLPFNGRENARCAACLSMERTRLLWLILNKLDLFRPGLRVMHVAPELPLVKRYSELLAERYHACDFDVSRYTSNYTTVRPLDLCCDLVKLPSRSFDVIIHVHVLEHVRCGTEGVLQELERILAPGGHHLLSVPVRGELTIEDLSDDLTDEQRFKMFGQADHMRIFGRKSFPELLDRVWGVRDKHHIDPIEHFSAEELEVAAIPKEAWTGISSHTIFCHQRPKYLVVKRTGAQFNSGVDRSSPNESPGDQVHVEPNLILHIGMPKAGTTSLQHWLHLNRDAAKRSGIDYWDIAENHSQFLFMAFAGQDRIARGAEWFQRDPGLDQVGTEAARNAFDGFLDGLGERTGIVSAEILWTLRSSEVTGLAEHLKKRGIKPLVLCWIRPPAEFLNAAAQQRLQSSLSLKDLGVRLTGTIPINYRRLESWSASFGQDKIVILPFGGNVLHEMRDFLRKLRPDFAPEDRPYKRLNRSVSLLAAKALLALNEAAGESRERDEKQLIALRKTLHGLAGGEFCLPESVVRKMSGPVMREGQYLIERFQMPPEWVLADVDAIDDALFFKWDFDEVAQLIGAIATALAELEGDGGPEAGSP